MRQAISKDEPVVNTFNIIDHDSRDFAVRDDISRQDKSAIDGKAITPIHQLLLLGINSASIPSPRKPKVETSPKDWASYAFDVPSCIERAYVNFENC